MIPSQPESLTDRPIIPGAQGAFSKSIDWSVRRLFIAIILGFCVVFAFLHELLRRCDQMQASQAIGLAIGESVARDLELAAPPKRGEARSDAATYWRGWCETRLHNDTILAVELYDSSGKSLASAGRISEFQQLLQRAREGLVGVRSLYIEDASLGGTNVIHVALPLPACGGSDFPERIALLLSIDQPLAGGIRHSVAFYLPLLAMGMGCYLLGERRLREYVLQPVLRLAQAAQGEGDAAPLREIAQRQDELGALAQSLSKMRDDLEVWRDQAHRVERRMDSKLSEETKRITQDLNRVQREAWIDSLTGVKNRRLLQERLPAIFDAQRKARKDLAIIMFDLDHFKNLNDTLGHWAGDELLAFTGELLRSCTRAEDVVARYGGDEFAVILPGAAEHDAVKLAERIIAMFCQRAKMIAAVDPTPSMTAGVASLHAQNPGSHRELLTLADRALYVAKRNGRSRAHALVRHEPVAAE